MNGSNVDVGLTVMCVGSRGNNQINAMSTWAFHFEEYGKDLMST